MYFFEFDMEKINNKKIFYKKIDFLLKSAKSLIKNIKKFKLF